ncbi:MAG TPA: sulfotransferase [Gemmataceae bacterium]|nr:sulfotransferase [Gemmataceae bacterium]
MTPTPAAEPRKPDRPREWTPHIWEGCDFLAWVRLLARNRFAVSPSCLHVAVVVTFVSFFHSVLKLIQEATHGARVRRTRLREAPIFIIGHWRTGTTLLHELLILDDRHTFPTTYECLEPNHFLLTEGVLTRLFGWFMPSRRPMDNMAAGWDRPQEDEFALCMMGQPSPYLTIAFPNRPPQDPLAVDLEGLPPRKLASWKRAFYGFLQKLTLRRPGRLVLKSPTHTCRIRTLLQLFPDARFVHIVRDPFVVFPSTVNLWRSLWEAHGLQVPTFAGLEEYVFANFTHLYERLEAQRGLVPPQHFYELKYEDLVRDPVGQMRALYDHLGLGGFDRVLPRLEAYLAGQKGYRTNRYEMTPELRAKIAQRWGDVIRRYGYGE